MNDVYLSKKKLSLLKPVSSDNKGNFGACYQYQNSVVKVFHQRIPSEFKKVIKKQLAMESELFLFPKKKLYVYDLLSVTYKGYVADSAPGISLFNLLSKVKLGEEDVTFDRLLCIYYDAFLPLLLKENVLIRDNKLKHMFIDDNVYFVDTDYYLKKPDDMSVNKKNRENLYMINEVFYQLFFGLNYSVYKCINAGYDSESYFDILIQDINKLSLGEVKSLRGLYNYKTLGR